MEQQARFTRGDWQVRIEAFAEQRATREAFHLKARLRCWSGEVAIFEQERRFAIRRNGM